MTVLAKTSDYLVEYEDSILTIARYSDGYCKAIKGTDIAGQFRACLKTHKPERVIEVYLKMMYKLEWKLLYKPYCMPR